MNCPLCVDAVLEVTYHAGIELDICPRCRGVWLDRGELDRIAGEPVAATGREPERSTPAPPPSGTGRPPKSRKRRLAERLGDVFDEVLDL